MSQSSQNNSESKQIILYKTEDGNFSVDVKLEEETVWLTQKQMADLFAKDLRTVNEHIKNIFQEGELKEDSTIRKFRIVQKEGKRNVTRNVDHFNLDAIISVGYRVNSKKGTQFRIWANKILKDYLLKGYALNQKRLKDTGLDEFEKAIALIKETIEQKKLTTDEAEGLLEVITTYTNSWVLLQKFDNNTLTPPTKEALPSYILNYAEAEKAIMELKKTLIKKEEASDLFGRDHEKILKGILGNLYQTFEGNELYLSVEEKAAHMLYFVIKDHPFIDGNKRIGVLLFMLFLSQNNYLLNEKNEPKFNDNALVALALLIAESDSNQKESIIKLVMNFVNNS